MKFQRFGEIATSPTLPQNREGSFGIEIYKNMIFKE